MHGKVTANVIPHSAKVTGGICFLISLTASMFCMTRFGVEESVVRLKATAYEIACLSLALLHPAAPLSSSSMALDYTPIDALPDVRCFCQVL